MDVNEFNNWKKCFKKAIVEFYNECCKLVNLHDSVSDIRSTVLKENSRYIKSDWKRFGLGEAWYGVDKLGKEIKWAEKEITFLNNMIKASAPDYLSFLDSYRPAREKWNELCNLVCGFEEKLGLKGYGGGNLPYKLNKVGNSSFLSIEAGLNGYFTAERVSSFFLDPLHQCYLSKKFCFVDFDWVEKILLLLPYADALENLGFGGSFYAYKNKVTFDSSMWKTWYKSGWNKNYTQWNLH